MTSHILVINPNSSHKVTKNLEATVVAPEGVKLTFYTAPPDSPLEITPVTSLASETAVLNDFAQSPHLVSDYDAFLVCCYSDHPLVKSLGKLTNKPVMGIMQATLIYALSVNRKSFILTSTSEWEPVLDQAVMDFIGSDSFPTKKFERTRGLNVNVTNLADTEQFNQIYQTTKSIFEDYNDVGCVLLGCAGMAGLDRKLSEKFPDIRFVDSVKIGIELLTSLCRFDSQAK
ncbi:DCG1 Protein DCG1 [Candida maltosa Xu316]|uniref:Hydantoin racemase n=1 Tax=Candida maltosa (strain Xu316) TaxID=1245528 RepID=M3JXN4_CANMX|nr:hypothetical protein G210_2531 [Candida maltosa Xu316]